MKDIQNIQPTSILIRSLPIFIKLKKIEILLLKKSAKTLNSVRKSESPNKNL